MDDDYRWIAGNDLSVRHEYLIDSGSFGRVHKVKRFLAIANPEDAQYCD
jgi:hypothetical protein